MLCYRKQLFGFVATVYRKIHIVCRTQGLFSLVHQAIAGGSISFHVPFYV